MLEYNVKNELDELNQRPQKLLYSQLNDNDVSSFNVVIGKNNKNNEDIKLNFEKNPHLLIGGASGSGKSCLINCIIHSLIKKYDDMFLAIIDIKQVEYMDYKNDPHLITPIVTTVSRAYELLNSYKAIMYNRYNILTQNNYRNINEYNANNVDNKMARHVIIIDELATLLLNNKNIKNQLQELLQLGRAAGIHLILATQAPNCKTIPTELKINITCRIALQVPTTANSRIIIDEAGAEKLKGCGDALIKINNCTENFQSAIVEWKKEGKRW